MALTKLTRVLAVDDDPLTRRRLGHALERAGLEVWLAGSAESALVCLRQHDFDLLLTDLQLPSLDGRELTRRACAVQPGLRVVWISAAALASPDRPLLRKPFSQAELRTFVGRALGRPEAALAALTDAPRPAAIAPRG
jgi:CheY-like chemotaxis protein